MRTMDEISLGDCTRGLSLRITIPAVFSTHEFLLLATVLDTDVRLPSFVANLEWEVLEVGLDLLIIIFVADEMLRIEHTNMDRMR
jgi:hypothetical protein